MRSSFWSFAATLTLLGGTLAASWLSDERRPDVLAYPLASIPKKLGAWVGADAPALDEGVLRVLLPTSYVDRDYRRDSEKISVFISYYAQQRAGESMHSPKNCLPGSGWEIWDYGTAQVPVERGKVTINKYSIQNNGNRLVVLYWYQSRQRILASEYLGKVLLMRDSLVSGNTAGSLVRLTVLDRPESLASAVNFASKIIPEVQRCLGH